MRELSKVVVIVVMEELIVLAIGSKRIIEMPAR